MGLGVVEGLYAVVRMLATVFRVGNRARDDLCDIRRARYLGERDALLRARALDIDISVVKNGLQYPLRFCLDILDARKFLLCRFTHEERFLFDIDDVRVRDNPDVQKVIKEDIQTKERDVQVVEDET